MSTDEFYGTSLSGYIDATYDELVAAFGLPESGDGYKTKADWRVVIDGWAVTVYDWKIDGSPVESNTEWNVGGHRGAEDVEAVLDALAEAEDSSATRL